MQTAQNAQISQILKKKKKKKAEAKPQTITKSEDTAG